MTCKDPSIAEAIGTGIADGAADGFDKLFNGFGNKPYFFFGKLGNLTYISDMANAVAMGNGSEMAQKYQEKQRWVCKLVNRARDGANVKNR